MRRKIYDPKGVNEGRKTIQLTEEQLENLKEMATSDAGNYQYDVPTHFKADKKTYTHRGMLDASDPSNQKEWNVNEEGIHIKEKNKGKFNATKKKTGKSTEELTHSKNPITRKRAVFAQNAARWSKKK